MAKLKFTIILFVSILLLTGCSIVTKLKEKLTSSKKESVTKEAIKENTSGADMNFYNKYIEVMNKIQESGESVYKYYMSDIPAPGSITKNSLIIPVGFKLSVSTLASTAKNYNRSLLDGGELSKLKASEEMQNEIESNLKKLLPAMEDFSVVSEKVSEYYSNKDYKNDLSLVKPYDEEMKTAYDKFKTSFDKFSSDLKKYKPKRKIYDPSTASTPDEASSQVMLNAYGDILDAAEDFFESFSGMNYKGDMNEADAKFKEFVKTFEESKNSIKNTEFSEKVKFMKYNFEDYFTNSVETFIKNGTEFFEKAPQLKSENDYRVKYNDMIISYNNMINSYNTNIGLINRIR